jgi:translation initiation factor IF-2
MEAIRDAIEKGSTEKVKASVIHAGVGAISENDVTFAAASRAVVIGFHVVAEPAARRAAETRGVEVRIFDIVYELLDDARALMQGLLPPKVTEQIRGHAEVRDLFPIPRIGTIAGCYVSSGSIRRSDAVRVVRDGVPIYTGRIQSLRRFKDDAREVMTGMECGIHVERFNDVKVGDILESFVLEETRETL